MCAHLYCMCQQSRPSPVSTHTCLSIHMCMLTICVHTCTQACLPTHTYLSICICPSLLFTHAHTCQHNMPANLSASAPICTHTGHIHSHARSYAPRMRMCTTLSTRCSLSVLTHLHACTTADAFVHAHAHVSTRGEVCRLYSCMHMSGHGRRLWGLFQGSAPWRGSLRPSIR